MRRSPRRRKKPCSHPFFKPEIILLENRSAPVNLLNGAVFGSMMPSLPAGTDDFSNSNLMTGALPSSLPAPLSKSDSYSYLPSVDPSQFLPVVIAAGASTAPQASTSLVANVASAGNVPDLMLLSQLDIHPFDDPHFPAKQPPVDPGSLPSSEPSTISPQSGGESGGGSTASGDGSALVGSDPQSSRNPDYTPDQNSSPSSTTSSFPSPTISGMGNPTSGIGAGVASAGSAGAGGVSGGSAGSSSQESGASRAPTLVNLSAQPVTFEENRGQTDAKVQFLARGQGYTLFLTGSDAVFSLSRGRHESAARSDQTDHPGAGRMQDVLAVSLQGANPDARAVAGSELPQRSNYFVGDRRITNVANFASVQIKDVYAGVDVEYYGTRQGQLEYDFVVAPGADLGQIRLAYQGASQITLDERGSLVLALPGGLVTQNAPVLHQTDRQGRRVEVGGRFVLDSDRSVGFVADAYDPTLPLVIDPVLDYSTYLGGSADDAGRAIAVDGAGNAYVTGLTSSTDFPVLDPIQGYLSGVMQADVFITRMSPDGSSLVYSTYLGGSGWEQGMGIAVDVAGNAYVTGGVYYSTNFPVTSGAFQTSLGGNSDAFVAKLNATGDALLYSTLLGSTAYSLESGTGIAVDEQGHAYVAGFSDLLFGSNNFPTTSGAFQTTSGGGSEAFVTKLNLDGTALVYSSFYGSSAIDVANGIAVDQKGRAFVVGSKSVGSFPVHNDVFAFQVNDSGSALVYDVSMGGSGDDLGNGIAIDRRTGDAWITGQARSGFPTTTGAYQTTVAGGADAFLVRLDATGATTFGTLLGGSSDDAGNAVAVARDHRATVTGTSTSTNFPSVNALPSSAFSFSDTVFAAQFIASGASLMYSTSLGSGRGYGVAVDLKANASFTGETTNLVGTTPGAFQTTLAGNRDAYVVKLIDGIPPPVLTSITTDTGYSSADFVTKDQTLVFDGTAPDLSTVHLFLFGVQIGTTTASGTGAWSFNYTGTTLPEDTYALTLQAELGPLLSVVSVPYRFIVDTTPPVVALKAPATTTSFAPVIKVWAHDDIALPPNATATIDVDLNYDSDFLDSGEQNVASASIISGYAQVVVPIGGIGNYHVQARVTDLAGNEGTSASVPVQIVTTPTPWDFDAYIRVVEHTDGLPVEQLGGPRVLHPLDLDNSPGSGNSGAPALVYNASLVHVRPIVQALVQLPGTGTLPSTFTATLTWNGGTPQTPVTFSTAGFNLGDKVTIAVQVASPVATTGRYTYQLSLTVPGIGTPFVANKSAFVRVEDSSAFGAGWTLSTLNRLVSIPASGALPAGQLWLYGDGTFRFFAGTTGTLTSPTEDHGALAVVGGSFVYTAPDDSVIAFNSSGLQTSWTAYDGIQNLQFSYSSGNLSQLVSIDGSTATFSGGSTITSISAPGGRTWTISSTSITDPDGRADAFSYDGNNKMLSRTFGAVGSVWTYQSTSELLNRATWGTSGSPSHFDVLPAASRGLIAPFLGEPYAQSTDTLTATTTSNVDRLGHLLQRVNGIGATEIWSRYADGLVADYTDPIQRVTSYTRDSAGYVTLETLPDTRTRGYSYGAFHQLASFTNERGKTTTYSLASGTGHVLSVTDAAANVTSFTYSSGSHLVNTITDPMSRVTTFTYDGSNRLATATTVLGTTTTAYASVTGEVASVTDPLTRVVSFTHDPSGRMLTATDPLTKVSTWAYNSSGMLEQFTDANGNKTKTSYDGKGRGLTEQVTEASGSPVARTALVSFDVMGRVNASRDPLGYRTLLKRDLVGQVYETTDPMRGKVSYQLDLAGQLRKESDQLAHPSRYQYNDRGWVTTVTDARGKNWTTQYNAVGAVTGTTDPLGKNPTVGYDDVGRVVSTNDGAGNTTAATYWADSSLNTATDGRGVVTKHQTDYVAKTTTVTQALGAANQRVVVSAFNVVGDVLNVKDGPTAATATHLLAQYQYDSGGQLKRAEDALGHGVDHDYDNVGNLVKSTDALGKFTQVGYDALNRPTKSTDPNSVVSATIRDAMDQVVAGIDGTRAATVAVYNPLGDNTFVVQPSGGGIIEKRFNAVGWQTLLVDPVGNATKWGHNAVGQTTLQTDPRGETKSFSYLDNGWLNVATDERGKTETYAYLDNGWVDTVVVSLGMATNTKAYTYNGNGQVESASDTNGGLDWTYDELGRLETFDDTTGNTLTYAYDSDFRLDNVSDTLGGVRTYDYDGADRVTGVAFNDGAAELSVAYTYNNRDEVTEVRRYSDDAYTSQVGKTNLVHDDAVGPPRSRTRITRTPRSTRSLIPMMPPTAWRRKPPRSARRELIRMTAPARSPPTARTPTTGTPSATTPPTPPPPATSSTPTPSGTTSTTTPATPPRRRTSAAARSGSTATTSTTGW